MKKLILLALLGAGCLTFGACQNGSHEPANNFDQQTHRTYNPQTGSWEQSPPFGKQSNKSDNQ